MLDSHWLRVFFFTNARTRVVNETRAGTKLQGGK